MTAVSSEFSRSGWWSWHQRWSISPSVPLLGLWLLFALSALMAWLAWGDGGWPVGSYWWDELALSGAAEAIHQGLVPARDFWAPFILPLYMKHWARSLVGAGAGYVLECLMQGLLVMSLLTLLMGRRRYAGGVYVVGALAVVMAVMPFNIGSVVMAKPGTVVFAGIYNRLGGAIIMLALLLPAVRSDDSRDGSLTIFLSCLLTVACLVKITVAQVVLGVVVVYGMVRPDLGWWRVVLMSVLLACVWLSVIFGALGAWQGYIDALKVVSAVRVSLLRERMEWARDVLAYHRLELFLLVFIGFLSACRGHLARVRWDGVLIWYLASCAMVTLYMLTNFGDNGFFPAVAAMYTLLALSNRQVAARPDHGLRAQQRADFLGSMSAGVLTLVLLTYVGLNVFWMTQFYFEKRNAVLSHFPVNSKFLAENYLIDESAWGRHLPIQFNGVPRNMQSPAVFASYVDGIDEAAQFLSLNVPDRTKSVYALDFPAYAFSLVGGYRVPRGSYAWLLFGHEVTIDVHPKANGLLSDVDVLMVPRCSLSGGNRRYLRRLYRLEIEARWSQIGALRCWDVYTRR